MDGLYAIFAGAKNCQPLSYASKKATTLLNNWYRVSGYRTQSSINAGQ